jgi:hypothetical protein
MDSTFFNVVFIAPVIPPLHDEPNPMADTRKIEASLKDRGTVTSAESSFVEFSSRTEDTSTREPPFCTGSSGDMSLELLLGGMLGSSVVQSGEIFKQQYLLLLTPGDSSSL